LPRKSTYLFVVGLVAVSASAHACFWASLDHRWCGYVGVSHLRRPAARSLGSGSLSFCPPPGVSRSCFFCAERCIRAEGCSASENATFVGWFNYGTWTARDRALPPTQAPGSA
jgi:hypothetical protein